MHNNKYIPSNDIAILIVYKIIKKKYPGVKFQ